MLFVPLLVAAAAAVLASPIQLQPRGVLPLRKVSNFTSIKNIVTKGQARINNINGVSAVTASNGVLVSNGALVSSGTVTNEDVSYVAPVVIGGHTWELIVDTGCKSTLQDALKKLH
jgi:hypothetical protein